MQMPGKISLFSTLLLSVLSFAAACSESTAPVDAEKMGQLMYEMYLVDEYIVSDPDVRAQSDSEYVYLPILEKFGLTIDDFNQAVDYYLHHIEEFKEISSSVTSRLQEESSALDSAVAERPANDKVHHKDASGDSVVEKIPVKKPARRRLDREKLKQLEQRFDENGQKK